MSVHWKEGPMQTTSGKETYSIDAQNYVHENKPTKKGYARPTIHGYTTNAERPPSDYWQTKDEKRNALKEARAMNSKYGFGTFTTTYGKQYELIKQVVNGKVQVFACFAIGCFLLYMNSGGKNKSKQKRRRCRKSRTKTSRKKTSRKKKY